GDAIAGPRMASRSGRLRVAATESAARPSQNEKRLLQATRGSSLQNFFSAPATVRGAMRSSIAPGDHRCSGFVLRAAGTLWSEVQSEVRWAPLRSLFFFNKKEQKWNWNFTNSNFVTSD